MLLPGVLLPPLLLVVPFGLFVRPLEVLEVPGALDPGVCSGEVVSPPEGAAASLLALKEPGFEPDELGSSIGSGLPLQPVSPPVSNSIVIRKMCIRDRSSPETKLSPTDRPPPRYRQSTVSYTHLVVMNRGG